MHDVTRLLQALVTPAFFISAAGLLILFLNVPLMGMVSRLPPTHTPIAHQ